MWEYVDTHLCPALEIVIWWLSSLHKILNSEFIGSRELARRCFMLQFLILLFPVSWYIFQIRSNKFHQIRNHRGLLLQKRRWDPSRRLASNSIDRSIVFFFPKRFLVPAEIFKEVFANLYKSRLGNLSTWPSRTMTFWPRVNHLKYAWTANGEGILQVDVEYVRHKSTSKPNLRSKSMLDLKIPFSISIPPNCVLQLA